MDWTMLSQYVERAIVVVAGWGAVSAGLFQSVKSAIEFITGNEATIPAEAMTVLTGLTNAVVAGYVLIASGVPILMAISAAIIAVFMPKIWHDIAMKYVVRK